MTAESSPTLFDYVEAAGEAANEVWMASAQQALRHLCDTGAAFTTDDLWLALEQAGVSTHEPRAMGAVVRRARQAGLITPAGYVPSERPVCHGRPVRVWLPTRKD